MSNTWQYLNLFLSALKPIQSGAFFSHEFLDNMVRQCQIAGTTPQLAESAQIEESTAAET